MKVQITEALKAKLIELKLIDKDADDDAIKNAAVEAILNEQLGLDEYKQLTADGAGETGSKVISLLQQLVDGKANGANNDDGEEGGNDDDGEVKASLPKWNKGQLEKLMANMGTDVGSQEQRSGFYCDVKSVEKMYDTTKQAAKFGDQTSQGAKHPYAGRDMFEHTDAGQRRISEPSELEKACHGAYLKVVANQQMKNVPRAFKLTDHDKELFNYALHEMKWGGVIQGQGTEDDGAVGVKGRKLTGQEIKTVIDDVSTGGLEIAPISFDDAVITVPLLFGELAPFVNMVPVTRGRRIESATLGNMSLTSEGSVADNESIPLFATSSFISAFDTTIHVCNGAIEIGLDLMSDSPIDLAGHVTQKYGELLLAWLDEQIAIGDGTTEPEGIMNASGTTSVSFGATDPTLGGYESQLFGVPKRYKQGFDRSRIRFAANETTYQRARSIPVGDSDARRLFGMEEENYNILNHGFSIVDNMTNAQGFFANLARYRMYRRLGLTLNMTTEGRELTLRNKMLITARARYGGRLEDGLAAAVTSDHKA